MLWPPLFPLSSFYSCPHAPTAPVHRSLSTSMISTNCTPRRVLFTRLPCQPSPYATFASILRRGIFETSKCRSKYGVKIAMSDGMPLFDEKMEGGGGGDSRGVV